MSHLFYCMRLISIDSHVSAVWCHYPITATHVSSIRGLCPFDPTNVGAVWRQGKSAPTNVSAVWCRCPLTPADIRAIWGFRLFAHIRSFFQIRSLENERPKRRRAPSTSYLVTPLASVLNLSQCAREVRLFSCEPSSLRRLTHLESARCYG